MSTNEFEFEFTHNFKRSDGTIIKIDVRPEALKYSSDGFKDWFKGKSSGDNIVWSDGESGVLLGVCEDEHVVSFATKERRVFIFPTSFNRDCLLFLNTPKTKIEWYTESQSKTIAKKRKNIEVELASDEEIGEIKFVKKIAKKDDNK